MRLYFIFFTLILLNSCVYQQGKTNNPTTMSNSNVVIKFDTINLGYNQIKYKSDLKNKMLNCHPSDSFNLEVLSKFQVENILNILDEELNTNSFNNYVKPL
ncbi:MAG: hypothetical protein HC803_10180 [Saprospiraceae bacterium]|nr:hypothetical protein [Saprospiraceae bacterium]